MPTDFRVASTFCEFTSKRSIEVLCSIQFGNYHFTMTSFYRVLIFFILVACIKMLK